MRIGIFQSAKVLNLLLLGQMDLVPGAILSVGKRSIFMNGKVLCEIGAILRIICKHNFFRFALNTVYLSQNRTTMGGIYPHCPLKMQRFR